MAFAKEMLVMRHTVVVVRPDIEHKVKIQTMAAFDILD